MIIHNELFYSVCFLINTRNLKTIYVCVGIEVRGSRGEKGLKGWWTEVFRAEFSQYRSNRLGESKDA